MSFSIICNSLNGTPTVANNNNDIYYFFDFGFASKHTGKFKLSFSFQTEGGMGLSNDILYLATTLPVSYDNFSATSQSGSAKSQILGFIAPNKRDDYYFKHYLDSSPVILQSIPSTQNQFQVSLYNATTNALDTTIGSKAYTLILYFEAI